MAQRSFHQATGTGRTCCFADGQPYLGESEYSWLICAATASFYQASQPMAPRTGLPAPVLHKLLLCQPLLSSVTSNCVSMGLAVICRGQQPGLGTQRTSEAIEDLYQVLLGRVKAKEGLVPEA
ncbi:hypothetical protein CDD83_7743 [Cordyceps sp. RAO-2017]|nr:hypothetical protein CDD83_7743 [Cordyceps sp. RAO-2017]